MCPAGAAHGARGEEGRRPRGHQQARRARLLLRKSALFGELKQLIESRGPETSTCAQLSERGLVEPWEDT